MKDVDIGGKFKKLIRFGLVFSLILAVVIGYGIFRHYHHGEDLQIAEAKVTGTMVSARTLVGGRTQEFLFSDGDEVQAGDVIARLEVKITAKDIKRLENAVKLAKQNYEKLKLGQTVKVAVTRTRTLPGSTVATPYSMPRRTTGSTALSSLEERASRMDELYEMGAVSATQRDSARRAYENARMESYSSPSTQYSTIPSRVIEETEYVDQLQPTPPKVLENAEKSVKQAELALNIALQEAQKTDIVAPVSGTIYYVAELDENLNAGNVIARIGDSNELWLAAEVSEEVFNKVQLGKTVDYVIAGNDLKGTVIEKISPDEPEEIEDDENSSEESSDSENISENDQNLENNDTEDLNLDEDTQLEEESDDEDLDDEENTLARPHKPLNDKYILRVSLPTERNFVCKPNNTTTLKIHLF